MPESLSPELITLRDTVHNFINTDLRPLEEQIGEDVDKVPSEIQQQVRERSRELGLFGMTQPEELGGSPAGPLTLTVVREALATANLRVCGFVMGPSPGVIQHAEGELREKYLPAVMRGEKRGAFAFTEPRDAERPTFAIRDGDDLLVTGRKSYVTGGADADFYAVLVNVQANGDEPKGTAMVVIDRKTPGIEFEREFRSMEGGNHVSVAFKETRVPQAHIIGKIGEGMPRALNNIGHVRLYVSTQAVGWMQWTLGYVEQHLLAPHRTGTPLGEREGVRMRYSDMRIEAYAARSMLYRTARLAETNENVVNEVMATKIYTTECAGRVIDGAVQLVGGQALVEGHPLEKLYRQVRSMRLIEGASDLLRLNLARGRLEYEAGRI
ncbi:MAG: acyl-CoA dehydrogenase [Pseudomonadota bacterium]